VFNFVFAGTYGQIVQLNTNYFRLPTVTKWQLYQYRVHFELAEDCKTVKHKMVRDHEEKLGVYMFNGTVLFSPHKYHQDVSLVYLVNIICTNMTKQTLIQLWGGGGGAAQLQPQTPKENL
jgi:hypothetical protein